MALTDIDLDTDQLLREIVILMNHITEKIFSIFLKKYNRRCPNSRYHLSSKVKSSGVRLVTVDSKILNIQFKFTGKYEQILSLVILLERGRNHVGKS